jgi:uncharacterized protein (DUF1684 family)
MKTSARMFLVMITGACIVCSSCGRRDGLPPISPADSLAILEDNTMHRAEVDAFFRKDPASPFVRDTSIQYHGLKWFPVNPAFRGESVLHLYADPETVVVMGTRGEERRQIRYGYFEFIVPGDDGFPITLHLNAYKFSPYDKFRFERYPENLSVWFTDRTTATETYQVGRYVDIGDDAHDPVHVYTLDLNKAYNPYCAYSSLYSCAIPRKEDHLDLSLRVGEMKYHE